MRIGLTIFILLLLSFRADAQFSSDKIAVTRIQKGKWKSAEDVLRKSLRKDSTNTIILYVFAWFYQSNQNPAFNVDSAHHYNSRARHDFQRAGAKERERIKKFPVDSIILEVQKAIIDSIAFENAKRVNVESSYDAFIKNFPAARQYRNAVELRDEVAFIDALKQNTVDGFQKYLSLHQGSVRAREAQQRFDQLLYLEKTREGSLRGFEAFYNDYPDNSLRREAERNIFEISTASGSPSSFIDFQKKYPAGHYQKTAQGILEHLLKDDEHEDLLHSDSIRQTQKDKTYWVAVFRNGKYGFIDRNGLEMLKPEYESIASEYRCGNIRADFLLVSGGIINRNGSWIYKGPLTEVTDISIGFLLIRNGNCLRVLHKSGSLRDEECLEDAKLINHSLIAFRKNNRWGIRTLTNRVLLEAQFDDVMALDTLIVLVKNGKKILTTLEKVAAVADNHLLNQSHVFDDVRRMSKGKYLVWNGSLQGVINERLEFIIPLGRQIISLSTQGFILDEAETFAVTGVQGINTDQKFDAVKFYGNWIRLRKQKGLMLYNIAKKKFVVTQADTIWFENQVAFVKKQDSLQIYVNASVTLNFAADAKVTFIKSPDSSRYFYADEKKRKTVFNANTGSRLFSFTADEITGIGNNNFIITKGNKRGIVSVTGKLLLPVEYSAIVPQGQEWLSLFKDRKFGLFELAHHKLIKPVYDRNVRPLTGNLLVAFKDGAYGFIDEDAKPKSLFEFAEVQPWNDTSVMIKKNNQWMIYTIKSRSIAMAEIKDFRVVQDHPEKILIIRRNVLYGVISSLRGELIPASYNDIVNVGSPEEPMFFSEKYVEEAGIHVVVYYDRNGTLIRKQAYDEEEYDRIYCD